MMKKILKTTAILFTSAALLFALSCTIGLGDAVDTAAPTIDISYPPKNAVIRDSFIVSGICDDDLGLESVKVTVTNTATKDAYGPYEAKLSSDKKSWSVELNKKAEGEYDAFNAYKQWEYPDGDYIVSAVSYDKSEKASQAASLPFSIDNTAPVLIVSKPLAVGTETASVYGRNLNIIGDISEAHVTTKLTLNYKEFNENTNTFIDSATRTLEITGFGTMSSDNPLTIAKYNIDSSEADSAKLTQNYLSIYGTNIDLTQSNKKNFYCGFQLEDNARVYRNPGDAGEEGGNQTSQYYILSDNYNENLFSETTYSLNARNLMLLLNGQSSYTDTQIADITSKLRETGNSASSTELNTSTSSKFSIDPKNNPIWAITNFDFTDGTFGGYDIGSAVPLVLKVGGDGIEIDKSSIEIEIYHLGNGEFPESINASTPHCTLISRGTYTEGSLKEALDNDSSIVFSSTDTGIKINHFYEFRISGTDVSGNSIESEDGKRFGFKRNSTFASPRITFVTDSESYTENAFYKGTTVDSDGITIKGTIVTGAYEITIPDTNYLKVSGITITDTSDSNISISASETDYAAAVKYNTAITSFVCTDPGAPAQQNDSGRGKTYSFTAKITKKAGSNLSPVSRPGAYKYKVAFIAEDSYNTKSEATEFEFRLDNKAPEIKASDIVITPLVNQGGTNYINGTVTVKGTVSDVGSGFDKLYWGIGDAVPAQIYGAGATWSFELNTLNYDGSLLADNQEHILKLYADDTVGNRAVLSYTIHVKQETDIPVIDFTNAELIFTKTNNKLVGTITDDDGLASVTATYRKVSPGEPATSATEITGLPGTASHPTSYGLNIDLPSEEGEYEISITANDVPALSTGTKTRAIIIKKDNGAPELKITSPTNVSSESHFNTEANPLSVTGTVKDGSGVANITREVFLNGTDTPIASLTKTISVTGSITAGANWTDNDPINPDDGIYKVRYTAKDKYAPADGHTADQEFVFTVDKTAPLISSVTLDGNEVTGWFNKNYGNFAVTVSEPVAYVQYSTDYAPDASPEDIHWINMSGSGTSWNADVTLNGTDTTRHLYIKATDKAGNATNPIKNITLKMDLNAPTLTVASSGANSLSNVVYVNKESDLVFTGTYSDGTDESGLTPLKFKIGDELLPSSSVTVTPDVESETYTGTYTATINKNALANGLLKVIGTDKAGNVKEVSPCTLIVDTVEPEVNELSLAMDNSSLVHKKAGTTTIPDVYYISRTSGETLTSKLTISGTATDDYLFEKITLQITGEGQTTITQTPVTTQSWSFTNIDLSSWPADKTATVTLTAYDKAGNTNPVVFNLKFDEVNPAIGSMLVGQDAYEENTYSRQTALEITSYITETGSGLSKLEYKLYGAGGTETPANLQAGFGETESTITWTASGSFTLEEINGATSNNVIAKANISGFKQRTESGNPTNYLLLRAIDNCGRVSGVPAVYTINIDQTSPTIVATSTERLTNGKADLVITGAAYDAYAGLKALRVKINNEVVLATDGETLNRYGKFEYTGYASTEPTGTTPYTDSTPHRELSEKPTYATWTLTLTPDSGENGSWFDALLNSTNRPEIAVEAEDWALFRDPATNTVTGNKAPNATKVAVLKIDTVPPVVENISPANNASINGSNTITGTSSDEGSVPVKLDLYYSLDSSVPSTVNEDNRIKTLTTASSPASNPDSGLNVSQLYNFSFADIDFYDSRFITSTEASKDVWIIVVATDEAGNKSAINPIKYTVDRNSDRPVVSFTDVELPEMSISNPKLLKERKIYISITDDDGFVNYAGFRTNPSSEYTEIPLSSGNGSFSLSTDGSQNIDFKIIDHTNKVFTSSSTTDWEKVIIRDAAETPNEYTGLVSVILDTSSPELALTGIKTDSSFVAPASFDKVLGGTIKNVVLKFTATDSGSGIDAGTVKAIVKCGDTEVTGSPFIATRVTDETDTYTVSIPCATGNGVLSVKLLAKDKAEREGSTEKQFDLDNTAPEIHVESPSSNKDQSGTITAVGYVTESVKLSYAISPVDVSPSSENYSSTNFTVLRKNSESGVESTVSLPSTIGGTTLAEICSYKNYSINPTDTVATFYLYFDGTNSTPHHTSKLNNWLVNLGITTEAALSDPTDAFDDIVRLYIHLRAEDAAGNVSETAYPISIDPQGERPKVEFSYPATDNQILGGSINIIGSVTGIVQEYTIYMQIGHMEGDQFVAESSSDLTSAGYTLTAIPGRVGESGIAIPVNGSVWSKKINENGEFDPTTSGSTRSIAIRLYAVDSDGRISSAKTRRIKIDNDIPVISQDVDLVRWNSGYDGSSGINVDDSGNISYVAGATSAIRSYSDGISVAGKWYAVGKVTDDSGISEVRLGGSEGTLLGTTINSDGAVIKSFTVDGKTNYVFCFPLGADTPDAVEKIQLSLYAKDGGSADKAKHVEKPFTLTYDNKAPDVSLLSNNLKILNNNGYYTFGSDSFENSVSGANQTGVERIAFFFTRTIDSTTKLLNPMIKNREITSGYTMEDDGLYWTSMDVTVSGTNLTLSEDSDNIHSGGLAKVNGIIYRINSKSGTLLTLSDAPGNAVTTAKFALAEVVDNTIPEDASHDDGDQMIEKLIKTGTKYSWEASIDSKKMSDGPVVLHYVVFDKAGNYTKCEATGIVQNNSPRLAGAYVGTDEDGNGTVDEVEFKAYHKLFANGYNGAKKITELTLPTTSTDSAPVSAIKIKRKTVIKPEIVGGNGTVGYTYSVAKRSASGWASPYKVPAENAVPVDLGSGTGESNDLVQLGTDDSASALALTTNNGIVLDMEELLTLDDGEKQKFVFTIWDSTPGLTYGTDTQSATLNIIMDVAVRDSTPAKNKIIPFYWKGAGENSLKDDSIEKGHIELSKDLAGLTGINNQNPKISGAIKLEGIALDNSLLKELTVNIGDTPYQIATYSNGSWSEKTGTGWQASITNATYGEMIAAGYITSAEMPEDKTDSDIAPYASQEYGHVVHWTMVIDTEAMTIPVQTGLVITVSAKDHADTEFENNGDTNPAQTGGNDGTSAHTCKYTVDLVPYIKSVKTKLSSKSKKSDTSEYDRTALGHYPVASTETIKFTGFNLAGGKVHFTSADANVAEVDYNSAGFTIPANTKSGEVSVIVSGVESLNNKNFNNAQGSFGDGTNIPAVSAYGDDDTYDIFSNFYNRKPNSTNNYILTDDVIFDIWEFNSDAGKPYAEGNIADPIMKINPASGIIGFAYQSGDRRFSMANNDNSYEPWVGDFDNLSATGFAYDSEGNTYGTALGGDINNSPSVSKFVFLRSKWGHSGLDDSGVLSPAGSASTTSRRIEQIGQVGTKADTNNGAIGKVTYNNTGDNANGKIDKFRFVSPSIAVSGSGDTSKVYLAYYDKTNQEIRFKWADYATGGKSYINDRYKAGNLGSNGEINNNAGKKVDPDNYCVLDFQIIAENISGTSTSLGTPGPYVALDVIPANTTGNTNDYDVVVLVWYDETGKQLLYTYNTVDLNSVSGADFEGSGKTKVHWHAAQQIFSKAGQYCQIKVDAAGGVHIVAQDTNAGDVWYAKLNSYSGSVSTCMVDSNGMVGSNLTLDVAIDKSVADGGTGKAIPYISYYGSVGPKMAYLTAEGANETSLVAGAVNNKFTGYWEVTDIPSPNSVPKDRINVGVWKDSDGVIKDSTVASTITPKTPAGDTTSETDAVTVGNGTENPVVAYEIRPTSATGRMETAQKK